MSFAALLIHTVLIYNPEDDDDLTDRYGNTITSDGEGVSTPARVAPLGANETDDLSRDTRSTSLKVFLPKTADVDALSLIEWEGNRYRVTGEPNVIDGRSSPHHIELNMERTEG